jgi:hypothetical protein
VSRSDLTFTREDLHRLGLKVQNGRAVPIDTPEPQAPKPPRPEFPDQSGSWCLRGVWYRGAEFVSEVERLESANQRQIIGYARSSLGCTIGSLSQFRKSKVALGTPDLWLFGPPRMPIFAWWETKTPWGRPHTDEQIQFALNCQRTGTIYGTGAIDAFLAFADATGLRPPSKPR